jgi:hypothetical protein
MGRYTTQTWMIDVRPWFDFPRPIPSCQPIFWSNLLPTLSDPIPDFVGSSYEIEAASSLVLRYFSCKHYHHNMSSNTLLCNCKMINEMYKFLIYFCLTCFRLSFSPSSEEGVQLRQWFKSPVKQYSWGWCQRPGADTKPTNKCTQQDINCVCQCVSCFVLVQYNAPPGMIHINMHH